MSTIPEYLNWLKDTKKRLKTADNKEVSVFRLNIQENDETIKDWASRFWQNYCSEEEIDILRGDESRHDYLLNNKFPSTSGFGPGIRAGDFSEILFADYLHWRLGFWVPMVRWDRKIIRNESAKGCDVIGFRMDPNDFKPTDALFTVESKANLSGSSSNAIFKAVKDSAKDHRRLAESLNYIKARLLDRNQLNRIKNVERFQNIADHPYNHIVGAGAIYSEGPNIDEHTKEINTNNLSPDKTTTNPHPFKDNLALIIITGEQLMAFVHQLYERAANEA